MKAEVFCPECNMVGPVSLGARVLKCQRMRRVALSGGLVVERRCGARVQLLPPNWVELEKERKEAERLAKIAELIEADATPEAVE